MAANTVRWVRRDGVPPTRTRFFRFGAGGKYVDCAITKGNMKASDSTADRPATACSTTRLVVRCWARYAFWCTLMTACVIIVRTTILRDDAVRAARIAKHGWLHVDHSPDTPVTFALMMGATTIAWAALMVPFCRLHASRCANGHPRVPYLLFVVSMVAGMSAPIAADLLVV